MLNHLYFTYGFLLILQFKKVVGNISLFYIAILALFIADWKSIKKLLSTNEFRFFTNLYWSV